MIAIDTNILVHAHREDSAFHAQASRCVAQLAEGRIHWALPWPCLHEFFAIATHTRIFNPPTPLARALDQIDAWLESPCVVLLTEGEQHWTQLRSLLVQAKVSGPMVHDARIAALCIAHGVRELWSADRDFGRFAPLRVVNPLVA